MLIGDCDCPIYTVKVCGKLKIEFTQNDLLFIYLFYACQHVLCLSALLTLVSSFDACQFFSCLSAIAIVLFMPSECAENWKSITQNDLLFNSDLCGLSFGSRQNRLVWVQKLLLAASSGYASGDTFLIQFILWKSMTYWIPNLMINFLSISLAA